MCTVLLPPGDNPIAVNKYININKKIYIAGVQPEILAHIVTSRNGKNHSC